MSPDGGMAESGARLPARAGAVAIARAAGPVMRRIASWGDRRPRRARPVIVAVFLGMLGVLGSFAYLRPAYNWDMLGYIGVAESIETRDPVEVHRLTYAAAAAALPEEAYRSLIGESGNDREYRRSVAADPEAFRQQLPFYAVKPLYPALIYGLGKVGFERVQASVLLAIMGYIAAMLCVLLWFSRYYPPLQGLVLASLAAASSPVFLLPRLSSPDSLAVFLVVAGAFSLIELHRPRLALGLFALAVLDRPNTIILLLMLIAYLAIWAPPRIALSLPTALVTGVVAATMYFALSTVSGMYPLQTLFYFALIELLPYPARFTSPLGPVDYLKEYAAAVLKFDFVFVLIGVIVIRIRLALSALGGDVMTHVTWLILASLPLHWLVYPKEELRTMAPQFVLLLIFLVLSAGDGWASSGFASGQPADLDEDTSRDAAPPRTLRAFARGGI